jgi:hypothetical protein
MASFDALQKLRKANMSFVMSVCPSVRNSSAVTGMDFYEIWYLNIFRPSVEEIRVSLKSDKNNEYFTWRPMDIYDISLSIFKKKKLFVKNMSYGVAGRTSCNTITAGRIEQYAHYHIRTSITWFLAACLLQTVTQKLCDSGHWLGNKDDNKNKGQDGELYTSSYFSTA